MNKFTVRPNKSVKDMIEGNRIVNGPRQHEPQKAFIPTHVWDNGLLDQYPPKFSFGDAAERLKELRNIGLSVEVIT
jgi:hypothetical protein